MDNSHRQIVSRIPYLGFKRFRSSVMDGMDDRIFNYYAATFYFIRGVIGVAIITAMISRRNIWKVDRGG